jgi:hypothetical protein
VEELQGAAKVAMPVKPSGKTEQPESVQAGKAPGRGNGQRPSSTDKGAAG